MTRWDRYKNFKKSEFKCPHCGLEADVSEDLLNILQFLRNTYEVPVDIKSGCRCQEFNDSLPNSVKTSDHVPDKDGIIYAADIQIKGHQNSLGLRKPIMTIISKHVGFKYCYCDGAMLKAGKQPYSYSAPLMGKSIHISVNK